MKSQEEDGAYDLPEQPDVSQPAPAKAEVESKKGRSITPVTRRWIIIVLGMLGLVCVLGEILLQYTTSHTSGDLMLVASACVGAIGGMAVPPLQQEE